MTNSKYVWGIDAAVWPVENATGRQVLSQSDGRSHTPQEPLAKGPYPRHALGIWRTQSWVLVGFSSLRLSNHLQMRKKRKNCGLGYDTGPV